MGIWHSRQTSSLRGNRFCRRPERSHCFDLYVFRHPALSWTLLPTLHESRTFAGDPDCASVGEKSRYHFIEPTALTAIQTNEANSLCCECSRWNGKTQLTVTRTPVARGTVTEHLPCL